MRELSRSLVRYYVALRLSAGAATAFLPVELPRDREPIVRTSRTPLVGGMDPRELIERSGSIDAITIPLDHATLGRGLVSEN
ncbi:MAG: hypothetical protein M3173_01185 [Chloroflexota bacterium]|nr:hypothetical protein [Chloroflexota bacterium]